MLNSFIRVSNLFHISFGAAWTLQQFDFDLDPHRNLFLNSILSGKEFLSMRTNLLWISCLDIFSNSFPIFAMLIKTYLMSSLLSRKIFFSSSVQRPTFFEFSELSYCFSATSSLTTSSLIFYLSLLHWEIGFTHEKFLKRDEFFELISSPESRRAYLDRGGINYFRLSVISRDLSN